MSVPSISPTVGTMPPARALTLPPPFAPSVTGSTTATGATSATSTTSATSATGVGTTNGAGPPSFGDATILSVSTPAQLMAKMRQLAVTDPEEFKLLAAEMGGIFATSASASSGDDAQLLAKVASQFTQAASSGSLGATDTTATDGSNRAVEGTSAISSGDAFSAASGNRHGHGHQAAREASVWSSPAVRNAFGTALDAFDRATVDDTSS